MISEWRILSEGEIIQNGDEFNCALGDEDPIWVKQQNSTGYLVAANAVGFFRRLVG
jgi:hypothetical protein